VSNARIDMAPDGHALLTATERERDEARAEVRRLRREHRDLRAALTRLYEHPRVREQLAPVESLGSIRYQVEKALHPKRDPRALSRASTKSTKSTKRRRA
jgi:hypothetical protein